jgi:hypothetical protein
MLGSSFRKKKCWAVGGVACAPKATPTSWN